ncbi:hypothetical protein ABIB34_003005 [Rhodococcus sp. UYP5]
MTRLRHRLHMPEHDPLNLAIRCGTVHVRTFWREPDCHDRSAQSHLRDSSSRLRCIELRGPDLAAFLRGELTTDEAIVNRRAGLSVQSSLLREHRPDLFLRTQPCDPVFTGADAAVGQLVGDEAVAECGVVVTDLAGDADQVCIVSITLRNRVFLSFFECLGAGSENPAGHCDGDSVCSKVEDQRPAIRTPRDPLLAGHRIGRLPPSWHLARARPGCRCFASSDCGSGTCRSSAPGRTFTPSSASRGSCTPTPGTRRARFCSKISSQTSVSGAKSHSARYDTNFQPQLTIVITHQCKNPCETDDCGHYRKCCASPRVESCQHRTTPPRPIWSKTPLV